MNVEDLSLSKSTLGFLKARGYDYDTLAEHLADLTELDGIGPGRAREIGRAFDDASRVAPESPEEPDLPSEEEVEEEPREPSEESEIEEGGAAPADAPFAKLPEIENLVRYVDQTGKPYMARVSAHGPNGSLTLTCFTGQGGTFRQENVPPGAGRPDETSPPARGWYEVIEP